MIVVVLLSMLLLGIMTTYVQIQKLLSSQSIASQRVQQAEELYEILSHDLQNIVYEKWNKDYFFIAKKNITGGVRVDSLNFISGSLYSNPLNLQSRTYNVYYFGKVDDESGLLSLYRKEDMFVDYKEKTHGVAIVVLENIREFMAEFSTNGKDWQDNWDSLGSKNIPQHFRITIKYLQKDQGGERQQTLVLQTSPGIFM